MSASLYGSAHGQVHDEKHLGALPDGTIITWLRIPSDPTSEAVAFVHREVDPGQRGRGVESVIWVSPGGWQPMTPDEAGVTYPATVVRFGEIQAEHYLGTELETLGETLVECNHGGTWAREKALEAAVILYAGYPEKFSLDTAEHFEHWLDRADAKMLPTLEPEPECAAPTLASVMYALNQVWGDEAMGGGRNDNR